jgi:mannose-6-phosphate isomerase-like protein (cupin superfamily)
MGPRDDAGDGDFDLELGLELGRLAAIEPAGEVWARLLASSGGGRFAAFASPVATLFEVSVDRAHELLGLIERSASWKIRIPGIEVISVSGGPALVDADCAFLRIASGATFPMHAHVGEESAVVLAGRVHDATHDRRLGPGDSWQLAAGTRHELVGQGSEACICAVRARDGIVFAGAAAR